MAYQRTTKAQGFRQRVVPNTETKQQLTSFYKNNIGNDYNVLFESENKNGLIEGYTENYIRVRKDWNKNLVGQIRKVRIEKVDSEGYAVA